MNPHECPTCHAARTATEELLAALVRCETELARTRKAFGVLDPGPDPIDALRRELDDVKERIGMAVETR